MAYTGGQEIWGIAAADLNGDGFPDLAVTDRALDAIAIRLGTGTGDFGAPTGYPVDASPIAVAVGSFNGDALPDLVVANGNSSPT